MTTLRALSFRAITPAQTDRFWEVDVLRGVALCLMLFYHFMYDLRYFVHIPYKVGEGRWAVFADLIATMFVGLAGLSLTLSRARWLQRHTGSYWPHLIRRGIRILGYGMLVTVATWFVDPAETVHFGILHLIGVSIMLAGPFLPLRWLNVVFATLAILLGRWLSHQVVPAHLYWGLPFGFVPEGYTSFDYRPLFPWFGVMLLGIALGNALYPHGQRRWPLPALGGKYWVHALAWLGRHTLVIYLGHQPVFFLGFLLTGFAHLRLL